VFNKLDAIAPDHMPVQLQDSMEINGVQTTRLFVSARTGAGLPALREQLAMLATRHSQGARPGACSPMETEAAARLGTIAP